MNDVGPKQAPMPVELPQPVHLRWQPLRIGLVELYHYDVEEFWFRDGHLLLRGNNGTGKSKVLSLTLPFLLDANLSASRVEPDGDRTKRMEWNLLMGKLHERRVGYTWIEFGRRDAAGRIHFLTLGCGLRAVAGRSSVDPWFFITEQRVGEDLWLTTPERTVLTRERLIAAISARGEVFATAEAYRRAVDERLFGLGAERYEALVNTLIQLRQPQLSKQPNEQRLSDALTESLAPLDQTALANVAESMTELEDLHRSLEELEAMLKAVEIFGRRYRRYAQVAVRRRARAVRQAQTEYDQASRELNAAAGEFEKAGADLAVCRDAEQKLADRLAAVRARLEALRRDPRMIDAQTIEAASERSTICRQQLEQAQLRRQKAAQSVEREADELTKRQQSSGRTRSQLNAAHAGVTELGSRCGLSAQPFELLGDVSLPDGVTTLEAKSVGAFATEIRAEETRRREQIGVIRKRLTELASAQGALELSREARRLCAELFDAACEAAKVAASQLAEARDQTLRAWRNHGAALRVLALAECDELLEALERWASSLEDANPMRAALELAWRAYEEHAIARTEQLAIQRRALEDEQSELNAEQKRLEAGEDRPPPPPYTRRVDARLNRAGAPLWQLVDFAAHVKDAERAGLEAALEAAGILDAWVLPQGVVLDAGTGDVLLTERSAQSRSLAEWLLPTVPSQRPAARVSPSIVTALLKSVACEERDPADAEAWISPAGAFRLGVAQGSWTKPAAQYVGHTAREAARLARLNEIATQLAEIGAALAACDAELGGIVVSRQAARLEYEEAPQDERLLQAQANLVAQEQHRSETQSRLGEQESRVIAAQNSVERARDALELDARDLDLPTDSNGLDALERALIDLRAAVAEWLTAIREHQTALAELAAQSNRDVDARAELEAADRDGDEKRRATLAADETLQTLRATVGKEVDELLQAINASDSRRQQYEGEEPRARKRTEEALGKESAARQKRVDLAEKLEDRGATRRRTMDELQAFAQDTGFLIVATPDIGLPEDTAPWGVEAALNIARRAEQALVEIAAEESDWQRIQHEISADLTELQTSLSAQGHSATAESSQGCLIARILYRQRPMRPDALEVELQTELDAQKLILSAQEREILEEHLEKEIAANLQRMIRETEELVASMNAELEARPTSTGVRFRLEWAPLPEDDENGIVGLDEARKRLLKTSAEAWSDEDRRQLGAFLQGRIEAERQREDHGTVLESLSRALDYRRWHRFSFQRKQYGKWVPLAGPASSGERALGLTVPLFAAASSHYGSAALHAPRLVLLDEAFAGIDDEARASCMGLIAKFDLDFVMTSEREWGCYPELPGLYICHIVRREGMDAVHVTRWSWDGHKPVQQEDPTRRFPGPKSDVD